MTMMSSANTYSANTYGANTLSANTYSANANTAHTNTANAQQLSQYNRQAALSAPPARLLTMLYDRLLLDLGRAQSAQLAEDWQAASEQLLHAQAIVSELSGSLDMEAWDGAENLLGIYTYVSKVLMEANIRRDVQRTREGIEILEPLRQSWHEAAAMLPAQNVAPPAVPVGVGGMLGVG